MANEYLNTDLLDKAIIFATKAHAGTERRGKAYPYIIHTMEAVAIAATMTNNQHLLAAAALHDVIEDTNISEFEIQQEFGAKIAHLVASESDPQYQDISEEESWVTRKKFVIERLSKATLEEKIVAMGDKLSNLRAIYRDYTTKGEALWNMFHAPDTKLHEWHYRGLLRAFTGLESTFAYKEFAELVKKIWG